MGLRSYIHEKLDLASDKDELRSRAVLGISRYSPGSSYHRKHKQGIQTTTAVPIFLTHKPGRQKWSFLQATRGWQCIIATTGNNSGLPATVGKPIKECGGRYSHTVLRCVQKGRHWAHFDGSAVSESGLQMEEGDSLWVAGMFPIYRVSILLPRTFGA